MTAGPLPSDPQLLPPVAGGDAARRGQPAPDGRVDPFSGPHNPLAAPAQGIKQASGVTGKQTFAPDGPGGRPSVAEFMSHYRLCSDTDNRHRLVAWNRKQLKTPERPGGLRYVPNVGWRRWNGKQWADCAEGEQIEDAITVVKGIWAEANEVVNEASMYANDSTEHKDLTALAKKIRSGAKTSESESKIHKMLSLAKSHPSIVKAADKFDANPYEINCPNGMIDRREQNDDGSFILRPHDPSHLHTKITAASYDPNASDEWWEEHINTMWPDPEVRDFVQLLMGDALVGYYSEIFTILHGVGEAGTDTFLNCCRWAMGDYGHKVTHDLFLESHFAGGSARDDSGVAALIGVRLATGSEWPLSARINEARLRDLCGNPLIVAKKMRMDPIEFRNQATHFQPTNHLPNLRSIDHANRRRIRVIPCNVRVPQERRKPGQEVEERAKNAGDAILAWMMRGSSRGMRLRGQDSFRHFRNAPASVKAATNGLFADSDSLGNWLEDAVIFEAGSNTLNDQYFVSYETYFGKSSRLNRGQLTKEILKHKLAEEHGVEPFQETGGSRRRGISGMRLRPVI